MRSFTERFWNKVNKTGPNGCWVWTGALTKGYGEFWTSSKRKTTHRIIFELIYGEIPKTSQVCHICDNPACVNPAHLFLGSARENQWDMRRKGRAHYTYGEEKKAQAKLTWKDVDEIRRLHMEGNVTHRELARKFRIDRSVISRILSNERWRVR